MLETDPGFQPQHVLTASLSLPVHDYPTQQKVDEFYAELQRRIEALPGVSGGRFLVQHSDRRPEFRTADYRGRPCAIRRGRLPDCLELSGARELFPSAPYSADSRPFFEARDERAGAPLVAIIGQSFAERYFHGKDPIGLRMKVGDRFDSPMPAITVVGVVGDVKQGALISRQSDQMYEPVSQAAAALGPMAAMLGVARNMDIVLRTTGRSVAARSQPGKDRPSA